MYNKRQKEIIRFLSEAKFAKMEQLAEQFQVSLETIRRDLLELEKILLLKESGEGPYIITCGPKKWNTKKDGE